jgi:SM-20-related protein
MQIPASPQEIIFEQIVTSLMDSDYAVVDDFLPQNACAALLQSLIDKHDQGQFKKAGIGRGGDFQHNESIRADEILWMDKQKFDDEIQQFIDQLEALIEYCNRNCYTGIRDYEAHFAVYPSGAYYKRHLDQFKGTDSRRYTFIFYLNFGWVPAHGGMLRMYIPENQSETMVDIAPIAGRFVCFRSANIPHEVLKTFHPRYSITGWWLDQEKPLSFLR